MLAKGSTLGVFLLIGFVSCITPPKYEVYTISGEIRLPYAEIVEPFKAYVDLPNNRSRIDYYDGLVQTFQRGDEGVYGASYIIAYVAGIEPTTPVKRCLQVNGTNDERVEPQPVLPDLSQFKFQDNKVCDNGAYICNSWVYENIIGDKVNKYTFKAIANGNVPYSYEMMGYDSLIGSHYDKYIITYHQFSRDPISESVFDIPNNLTCTDFPGIGLKQHLHHVSPIQEFVGHEDFHVHHAFNEFRDRFVKNYTDDKEHSLRRDVFRQNFRYINSKNRAGLTYTLEVNHLADYTDHERSRVRGRLYTPGYNGGKAFNKDAYTKPLPESIDWRLEGAVTPVKDQAICGSCWSFGTVGTLEGTYFLKYKQLKRFSQQQLVDCSWNYQNNGCDGGEDVLSYQYILKYGLSTEEDYGPYLGVDGKCHQAKTTFNMTSYVNVTSGDEEALKTALVNHGPISVAIDASHKSLSFYANGVYYEPECMNKVDQLDHAVLAVGYGELNGEKYWLVKNSWSTYWGNNGYVLMSRKDNNCGVATAATFVNI